MSYLGNQPDFQAFAPAIDYFSGNGSTTSFTLSRPVGSVAQLVVVVANVVQNPSSAYTVSGNTITFTGAPPAGTNNVWVSYTSPITQLMQPSDGSVTDSKIVSVAASKLTGSRSLPSSVVPAGSVIQVVGGFYQAATAGSITSSSSLVSAGYSLSITPQFATSKIYVCFNAPAQLVPSASSSSTWGAATLYRNGSNLVTGTSPGYMCGIQSPATGGSGNMTGQIIMNHYDAPNTTSTLTYAVYFMTTGQSFQIEAYPQNANSAGRFWYAMEIAA